MTQLEVNGKKVEVGDEFLSLTSQQREAVIEEIAASLPPESTFMGQVNQRIASNVGGMVDFINPFDTPAVSNALGMDFSTGSAKTGLENAMDATGIARSEAEPEGFAQNFARGIGDAASYMIPATGIAKGLRGLGGVAGGVADDAFGAMASKSGVLAEIMAGGGAAASADLADEMGAPEWGQQLAGMMGGMGTGAIPFLGTRAPTALGIRKGISAVKRAAAPYTDSGARDVARKRIQELAGGEERAQELAGRITGDNEFNLTPAQRTGDENMLAVEQTAGDMDPALRDRLDQRLVGSNQSATKALSNMGGDVEAAQAFIAERRTRAKDAIQSNLDAAVNRAETRMTEAGPRRTETENSRIVADEIRRAETSALDQEAQLWAAVPRGAQVGTENAKTAAQSIIETIPDAQRVDIPRPVLDLMAREEVYGQAASVNDMHGLYSKLRQVARSAMAGNDQNKNMARIANSVADAILEDLGAIGGETAIGRAVNDARTFSRSMHETFSQGVVGRLLKRTLDGDDRIVSDQTLSAGLRGGGVGALVGAEGIERAAQSQQARDGITDYMRRRFTERATSPDGTPTKTGGAAYMRDNSEVLARYPQLRQTLDNAVTSRNEATRRTDRAKSLNSAIDNPRLSATAGFVDAPANKALDTILNARNPRAAAAQIFQTARRDQTGEAVDGLKGAVVDRLIGQSRQQAGGAAMSSGQRFSQTMQDPNMQMVMNRVFTDAERRRVNAIGDELLKIDNARAGTPDIGDLSSATPNRIIEYVARIYAANQGASLGNGGSSIQTAAMASGQMKRLLGNLQNDKAARLLMDAVEDPELFRTLLMEPAAIQLNEQARNRLAPYVAGTAAALTAQ